MGRALIEGMLRAEVVEPGDVTVRDLQSAAMERFVEDFGVSSVESNARAVSAAEVVLLCVNPQDMRDVLHGLEGLEGSRLYISIAAGVPLSMIEEALPAGQRVVRVMPNTPSLIGMGAAAYALGSDAGEHDAETVERILRAVGTVARVPEKLLDAVTGLSGSGPAYVYTVIEAMADGGVRMGLPRATALELAAQTVAGAAALVGHTGESPSALRDMFTSPGGTTIEGISVLEEYGVRSAFIEAVCAATRRSEELGLD